MKNSILTTFFIAVFGGIFIANGWAAPTLSSVSGTFGHNQSVTISGSGFGTKAQAAPVLWDDFESGTNGTQIQNKNATIGKWDTGAGSDVPIYSNVVKHAGNLSSYHNFVGNYNASLSKNTDFTRLYMDFWLYVNYKSVKTRNWKPWRFYGDTNEMAYQNYCGNGDYAIDSYAPPCVDVNDWDGASYSNNTWIHYQVEFLHSAAGASGGKVKQWINSVLTNNYTGITRCDSTPFREIRIGHYWAHDAIEGCPANSGADIYVDNVYIDTTWSRIELGNASTYAASTKREIQIPTAWSNTGIVATVNTGAFSANQQVYLYVVDSTGAVNSNGYPITIGSGSGTAIPTSGGGGTDTAGPASPSGLRIIGN